MLRINAQTHSWTKGHKIRGTIIFPGAGYAESALEAGARTITSAVRGIMHQPATRAEAMSLLLGGKR